MVRKKMVKRKTIDKKNTKKKKDRKKEFVKKINIQIKKLTATKTTMHIMAQPAVAAEYTDCISEEGVRFSPTSVLWPRRVGL